MMIMTFILTFCNTALLIIILDANFSESSIALLRTLFTGQHTDWGSGWYQSIGPRIIEMMIITSIMPIVELVVSYLKLKFYRWQDRNFTCDIMVTKQRYIYART